MRILGRATVRLVHGVALGRGRQINGGLRERRVALRHADEVHGVFRRDGDGERLRVRVADVLRCEAHQPAGDVQRIFAGFEHARQPVDGRIRIAVAHRFVQRRDQVVMLLAGLVVQERAPLDRLVDPRGVDIAPASGDRRRRHAQLEQVQRHPRVAVGIKRDRAQRLRVDRRLLAAEAALRIGERARQNRLDVTAGQRSIAQVLPNVGFDFVGERNLFDSGHDREEFEDIVRL